MRLIELLSLVTDEQIKNRVGKIYGIQQVLAEILYPESAWGLKYKDVTELNQRITEVPLLVWNCTDSIVGMNGLYKWDEANTQWRLFAVTKQMGRKWDVDVSWVSKSIKDEVKTYFDSFLIPEDAEDDIVLFDCHENIDEWIATYTEHKMYGEYTYSVLDCA